MPIVNYNGKTVSDEEIRNVLESAANYFEADINVTSGDRNYVPKGGSKKSMHLKKRAADFHVVGYEDAVAFLHMKTYLAAFFASGNSYGLIRHGVHTATGGAHLHIGRYGSTSDSGYVKYVVEGLTSGTRNVYSRIVKIPLLGVSKR